MIPHLTRHPPICVPEPRAREGDTIDFTPVTKGPAWLGGGTSSRVGGAGGARALVAHNSTENSFERRTRSARIEQARNRGQRW